MAGRILPFGDAALLVELATDVSLTNARRARALATAIGALRDEQPGVDRPVAAAATVLVPFDPLAIDADAVEALLAPLLEAAMPEAEPPGARHDLPVEYGGRHGPDLDAVAAEVGLRPEDVIELHAGREYEVMFLGFAPGFAYLGEVHARLVVPRLATPRIRVPAGSVAITGSMTAVYPQASPGGWRILGRTDAAMFDPGATPPARLRPGDRVRFAPLR
jgi:KipI family sensor histidine kinase inhibitor